MRIGKRDHDKEQTPLDNVRILERRLEWLDARIRQAKRNKQPAHYDISERDALRWALETVKMWVDIPNEEDELKDF